MAYTVARPKLNWRERMYLPAIVGGLAITLKHFTNMLLGRTKITMQYPEEKWTAACRTIIGARRACAGFGRACALRCLSAVRIHLSAARDQIIPGEIPSTDRFAKVEKYPEEFDIDMIRCIFCGIARRSVRSRRFFCAGVRHHWIHAR